MRTSLFINNEWRLAASGKTIDVVNPATEDVIAAVPAADQPELDLAVEAARAALNGPWGSLSPRERGRLVWNIGQRLLDTAGEVARLETLHNGKPITESRHIDIPAAAAACFQTTRAGRTRFTARRFQSTPTISRTPCASRSGSSAC